VATESIQVNAGDLSDPCPFIARYGRLPVRVRQIAGQSMKL
jgi:hypothetical protein